MTWPACGVEPPAGRRAGAEPATEGAGDPGGLAIRQGADGSFSLWSEAFGEGFHSGRGAVREARETFLAPSELERFRPGQRLTVVEVAVGTGTNTAVLLEACGKAGLQLEWWGLELDPAPLELALGEPKFRGQWQPQSLATLETLRDRGNWENPDSCGRVLWGDGRRTLPRLLEQRRNLVDLVWHDAFSPQHCPQLWTVEFLARLVGLLAPEGRWISYCSAAAVRQALQLEGLALAAVATQTTESQHQPAWSGGTIASLQDLAPAAHWRPLSTMEQEHLNCSAGEPYRDPGGTANAEEIVEQRRVAQATALRRGDSSASNALRKRWGVERH
jgi:tRNA U34 5-methylaminomethyl-2-thiouridine-forming methyltransferase MnmC